MGLDVRVPIGLMFAIIGALLLGYGIFGDHTIYARSLGLNINAIWGGVLLVTGVVFLLLSARRRSGRDDPADPARELAGERSREVSG